MTATSPRNGAGGEAKPNPGDGAFTLTRVLDAPRELVWKAWSEPERLGQWWGPKGCTVEVRKLEFRPGGFFHYAMLYPGGNPPMWGRFIYRAIEKPRSITWLNSFSNEGCGVTRAPFEIVWPLELLNTVTLAEQSGRTTLDLHAVPHGETDEERKTFLGFFASLEQGFGGTMDQLAAFLAKA